LEGGEIRSLDEGLEEKRWEVVRSEELRERVKETLGRIDDMLESKWGEEGSRWLSGREPGEAVVKGLEQREKKRE
jgi:hypothetical protein